MFILLWIIVLWLAAYYPLMAISARIILTQAEHLNAGLHTYETKKIFTS
jgi:hypothetical protein